MKQQPPSPGGAADVALAIRAQADKVQGIVHKAEPLPLDRLRDETAALQALVAEAARIERLGEALCSRLEAEAEGPRQRKQAAVKQLPQALPTPIDSPSPGLRPASPNVVRQAHHERKGHSSPRSS